MQDMNVFLDTSIVNVILDIDGECTNDTEREDKSYLKKLLNGPVQNGHMVFYVNPTIISQINNTPDSFKRENLLTLCEKWKFTPYNLTIFPFSFPATFITENQSVLLDKLCNDFPKLSRDKKVIADAINNENIDVVLTTDRKLAKQTAGLSETKFLRPKQMWELFKETNN